MPVMVDTSVLIHVVSEEPDAMADPVNHEKWRACRELFASNGVVLVSSIAWFEMFNIHLDDGTSLGDRLEKIYRNVQVEPLYPDAAEAAARLLGGATATCPKCHAHAETKPCSGCGREVGKALRL